MGGKKTFNGLFDCLKKTAAGPKGFFSLYAGFGVSLGGIIPYRGFQLGAFDTIVGLNPWKNDTGMMGLASTFAAAQTAIIKGTADCLKKIASEEGVAAGLYKGFITNALRSVGGALVLVLYDRAKTYLGISGSSGSE